MCLLRLVLFLQKRIKTMIIKYWSLIVWNQRSHLWTWLWLRSIENTGTMHRLQTRSRPSWARDTTQCKLWSPSWTTHRPANPVSTKWTSTASSRDTYVSPSYKTATILRSTHQGASSELGYYPSVPADLSYSQRTLPKPSNWHQTSLLSQKHRRGTRQRRSKLADSKGTPCNTPHRENDTAKSPTSTTWLRHPSAHPMHHEQN